MVSAPLMVLCSALVHQVPDEALAPPQPAASERPAVEAASGPLPRMRHDAAVQCGYLKPSKAVPTGHYRIQCDDRSKVCLVSPTHVLLDDGVEGPEPLARVADCAGYYSEDWSRRAVEGYRFLPAVAEAPPGWVRDERGRVMQVNFDLNRRVYFGGASAPLFIAHGDTAARMRADFGVEIELPGEDATTLNRIHLLESEMFLGESSSIDATLVRYDWSIARQAPLFWVTTFIGKPARHDFSLDAGGWFEALHFESVRRDGLDANNFLTLGSAHMTLDLWHSKDLVSYLRVRAGPSAELDTGHNFTAFKPQAAVEGDFTFDADGFHHAHFQAAAEKLLFDPPVAGRAQNPSRLRVKAGYELILIAINDYPLSLVLDGGATWRDDLPDVAPRWEFGAEAGLRFSFWAPARRSASVQRAQ